MSAASPLLERSKGNPSWRTPSNRLMEGFSLPATPSKAKPRRGLCSFTTLLVVFTLLAGIFLFNQELGGGTSRTETYYRKALVAKINFGKEGQTVTATSEEYRSTVGSGAAAKAAAGAAAAGTDGEGSHSEPRAALEVDGDDDADEFDLLGEEEDDGEHPTAGTTSQQQQQHAAATMFKASSVGSGNDTPLTLTISATAQSQGGGEAAQAQPTDAQQPATDIAQPQQQQGEEAQGAGASGQVEAAADPVEASAAWWSDVVEPSGERVQRPAHKKRDISASLTTAVSFDEAAVPDLADCKISVMDVDQRWGEVYGAGNCDLADDKLWPFASAGRGIDGHDLLRPEQYQYSMEYWVGKAIRNSSRFTKDVDSADFVFVDMNCYHSSWMAWLHPQNEAGRAASPSPEYYIKRSLAKLRSSTRFHETKGGDFGMVHPAPMMKGLFSEEMACEEFASVLNMVPERSSLCVWTQDSHTQGKSVLLPYAAVSDIDLDAPVVPAADRETLLFFQGGCGDPDPAVRHVFAAGKMLRYALVQELKAAGQADVHAHCACDICADHMPHDELMSRMSRSVFCPILPSNTQSSRRLSEAMLTGCIPVFVGAPFHTLPLASDVDYASFALFVNVSDTTPWVNASSPKWEHNHMISKAWKLDDPSVEAAVVTIPRLADLLTLLRSMPPEEVAARHAGVVANRLKFWYPPASAAAIATSVAAAGAASAAGAGLATSGALLGKTASGGGAAAARALADGARPGAGLQEELAAAQPGQSLLGELLMRKMCHRAAAVQRRLEEARQQGLDLRESDEKVDHPSLVAQQAASGVPAAAARSKAAGTTTQQAAPAARKQQQQQQGQQAQAARGPSAAKQSKGAALDAGGAAPWGPDAEAEAVKAVRADGSEQAASEQDAVAGSGGSMRGTAAAKGRSGAAKLAASKRQTLADL